MRNSFNSRKLLEVYKHISINRTIYGVDCENKCLSIIKYMNIFDLFIFKEYIFFLLGEVTSEILKLDSVLVNN